MKVLKEVPPTIKPWFYKAKCGPVENAPPVNGCSSEVELTLTDIFHREFRTPQIVGRTFHWRCPVCQVTNFIPFNVLPSHEVPTQQTYLEGLRKRTIIEIAKLHPALDRANIVSSIGDDFLLDDDVLNPIYSDSTLYS